MATYIDPGLASSLNAGAIDLGGLAQSSLNPQNLSVMTDPSFLDAGMTNLPTQDFSAQALGNLDTGSLMGNFTAPQATQSLASQSALIPTAAPMTSVAATTPQFGSLTPESFNAGGPQSMITDQAVAPDQSALGKFFGDAGMADYASMAGGLGGLYQAIKSGQMVNEQIQSSKDARQFAKDEQARQKDFIGTTQGAFSGDNKSNYYSA